MLLTHECNAQLTEMLDVVCSLQMRPPENAVFRLRNGQYFGRNAFVLAVNDGVLV